MSSQTSYPEIVCTRKGEVEEERIDNVLPATSSCRCVPHSCTKDGCLTSRKSSNHRRGTSVSGPFIYLACTLYRCRRSLGPFEFLPCGSSGSHSWSNAIHRLRAYRKNQSGKIIQNAIVDHRTIWLGRLKPNTNNGYPTLTMRAVSP